MDSLFPENWKLLPLADCMEAIIDYRGKTPRKSPFGIPLITAKIVKGGRILEPDEFIPFEDYDERMQRGIPNAGDVVVTTEAPLGEVAQLDDRKLSVGQRLITLRGKTGLLDNTYLKFLMMSEYVQNQLAARATGTTVIGIKQEELRKVTLVIPPFVEQRAIAEILGALDDKIELNRQTNQTLETLARTLFREKMSTVVEKGSILEFANLLSGGTPSTTEESYWNGNIEWVSAKDVSNTDGVFLLNTEKKITQAGVDNSATKLLPAKTTIVTARGTVGAHCMLGKPMTMNQTNYGLKAKEGIGDYFVFFTLSEMVEQLRQQSYGTIFDTITTKTFRDAFCAQPEIDFIQKFENQIAPLMETILTNQKESHTLTSLRDALLPKLMRGEVRVRDVENAQ